MRSVLAIFVLLVCAVCKTPAPAPREPADLPLDEIDVAVTDGGTGDPRVEAGDAGAASAAGGAVDVARGGAEDGGVDGARAGDADALESEGAGAGEQEEPMGIDLRDR